MTVGHRAERLFAELCGRHFLRGFVFHSPRYHAPTEREAGDVVLWVRRQLVVVELLAREADPGASTRQFVKRIGEKRRQLLADHAAYTDSNTGIELVNEQGQAVPFTLTDLDHVQFAGVVLLDADGPLHPAHAGTLAKTLDAPFPIAVMTRRDFLDLTAEVDTVPDLSYYLDDRADFLREVFPDDPGPFLQLGRGIERNLVAFYKLHDNHFPPSEWEPADALDYDDRYRAERRDDIAARDDENVGSYLIDELADILRGAETPTDRTLLHATELSAFTRRERAAYGEKLARAFGDMNVGRRHRHFAVCSIATGCWSVFYFHCGDDSAAFRRRAHELTRHKLLVEKARYGFEHSVFGYAFRKSPVLTRSTFDEVVLSIEDADQYGPVAESDLLRALDDFGGRSEVRVTEFPT